MILPTNLLPTAAFQPPSAARELPLRFLQMRINHLLKHLQVLGLFALRFSRPPSTWELNN